jgi:hypothetical protein
MKYPMQVCLQHIKICFWEVFRRIKIKVPEEKDIFAALLIRHGRYRKY